VASPARHLLLAAALACAVAAGAGPSDWVSRWVRVAAVEAAAAPSGSEAVNVTAVPLPAGGVLTRVAPRSPALTADPGAFTPPPAEALVALALALALAVSVAGAPSGRRGPVRRRGPPCLLRAHA
jgi:Flp pilus assembly protein CpaB